MKNKEKCFVRLTVYGLVQGVGFRPYTASLCEELKIEGFVKNTGGLVKIAACSDEKAIGGLISRLYSIDGNFEGLPGAKVTSVKREILDESEYNLLVKNREGFFIEKSDDRGELSIIPPDIGICGRCEREVFDAENRRFSHPFNSCVSCGPRFSIMKKLPYDRENTTMDSFLICPECRKEYEKSAFRRYAQTIACNNCGPKLRAYVLENDKRVCVAEGIEALELTAAYIKEGRLAAVKNTGGYHFAFDPFDDAPAVKLRQYKSRENKPFAVMFSDMETVRKYCLADEKEEELLTSDIRPIVLLEKRSGASGSDRSFSYEVSKTSSRIGAMLPCDAVSLMLSVKFEGLVMTSANRNSEPMVSDDERAMEFLEEKAVDIVLSNDRKIVYGLDDPVFQVIKTTEREIVQVIRRARGMVPKPVETGRNFKEDVFCAGGDLKAVFAFARGSSAVLSGYHGDLEDIRALKLWNNGRRHFESFFGFDPKVFLCDLHPDYNSVRELKKEGIRTCEVQHHYAHVMSVAAEHRLKGKFTGVALDGTGYGTDGNIWGSELLICDTDIPGIFTRAGHFEEVKLTGGENALKNTDIIAMCYVHEGLKRGYLTEEENLYRGSEEYKLIEKALENNINTYISTSAGRLFDAVSAALDICRFNTYEAECPVILQQAAQEYEKKKEEPENIDTDIRFEENMYIIDSVKLFSDIIKLKHKGFEAPMLSLAFHRALSKALCRQAALAGDNAGTDVVCLSGGVFSNPLLLRLMYEELVDKGFKVYVNEQVPPNDGGIALGQIFGCSGG